MGSGQDIKFFSLLLAVFLVVSLFSTGFVLADSDDDNSGSGNSGSDDENGDDDNDNDHDDDNDGDSNSGRDVRRARVEARIVGDDGIERRIEIRERERADGTIEKRIKIREFEAESELEIETEHDGTKTRIRARLSNGRNAEIKIMPDVAAQRAIEALRLNACREDEGCFIKLKEVGSGDENDGNDGDEGDDGEDDSEERRAVYEVRAEKRVRILGLFRSRMNVESEIDATTGDVLSLERPWWSFFAFETEESVS